MFTEMDLRLYAALKARKRDMLHSLKHIPLVEVIPCFSAKNSFFILLPFYFLALLFSKNFLCRKAFHGSNLFEHLHIEVLFIAENGIAIRLAGNILTGEVDNILQGELRQCGIYVLHVVVVKAQLLEEQIALEDVELCCSVALD